MTAALNTEVETDHHLPEVILSLPLTVTFIKSGVNVKCNFQVPVCLKTWEQAQIHKTPIFQIVRMKRCLEGFNIISSSVPLISCTIFYLTELLLGVDPLYLQSFNLSSCMLLSIFLEPYPIMNKPLLCSAISLSDHQIPQSAFPRLICLIISTVFPSQKPLF